MSEDRTLREALTRLLNGLSVDTLLFTTFTFDPEFFESNVLPVVTGIEHVATIRELQFVSEEANRLGVTVFVDGRVRGKRTKRATYPTIPVFIEHGVFHPKLVIASGTTEQGQQTRLLVTSANLTFAGWGHQREGVALFTVRDRATAEPLARFLEWLTANADLDQEADSRVAKLLPRLQAVERGDREHELHVSLPGERPAIARLLHDSEGPVTFAAPYFSPGFSSWLKSVCGDREVWIVPAMFDDHADLIQTEIDELGERPNVTFARFEEGEERYDHLKLLHFGGRLLLGSHNATMAALGDGVDGASDNVEVSVSFPAEEFPFAIEPIEPPAGKTILQKSEEREKLLSGLSTWITVALHWATSEYQVDVGDVLDGWEVKLPGVVDGIAFRSGRYRFGDADEVAQALQSRRVFGVWNPDGELVHEGFINETGWLYARPVGRFGSLRDCFDAWRSRDARSQSSAASRLQLLGESDDHDVDEMLRIDADDIITTDLLETYFSFFRAVRGLRESIESAASSEVGHADALMLQYVERAPGSLREAHRHIVEEAETAQDEDVVFWFVVVHELSNLAQEAAALSSKWPAVHECASKLQDEFAELRTSVEAAEWLEDTASKDGGRLRFILQALGYGATDVAV